MNKSEARELVKKFDQHVALNGTFSDPPASINGAQLSKARRILSGLEAEDAEPVTGHPLTGEPVSAEVHAAALADLHS